MKQTFGKRLIKTVLLISIFGFILIPVLMVIYMSFISTSLITFPPEGYSLKWYSEIASQGKFLKAFILSIEVSLIAMIISLLLGLFSSIALTKYDFKGKTFFQNFFIAPLIVPTIISGLAIYIFLFEFQQIIKLDLVPSFWSLVIAHVIITLPWTVRLITTGLEGMDKSIEEAAIDLGAKPFQVYWRVVIPSIRPSIVAAGIFSFIFSFNNLEISLMLVSPGQTTLPIEVLNYVFWSIDPLIAAISSIQIILVAILMIIADRFVGLSKVF